MRLPTTSIAALLAVSPAAWAADLPAAPHAERSAPVVAVVPASQALALELSRYSGQPLTVIYNEPGRAPWSVEPDLFLMSLGPVRRHRT